MATSRPSPPPKSGEKETKGEESMKAWLVDKSLGTAANLSKLLPTGTTLAFQTMAPSFTKGGGCTDHDVNFCFTWGLIVFLTLLCAFLSFTDCVTDREGHTYFGVATRSGLWLFNHELDELPLFNDEADKKQRLEQLKQSKRLRWRDLLHAIVSSAVFMTLAFCDASVQRCLVPQESEKWKEFLANVPLAVGFIAGFLFMIFPSTRNGIGQDGPPALLDTKPTTMTAGDAGEHNPQPNPNDVNRCNSSLMAMGITRVAPHTSNEINQVV